MSNYIISNDSILYANILKPLVTRFYIWKMIESDSSNEDSPISTVEDVDRKRIEIKRSDLISQNDVEVVYHVQNKHRVVLTYSERDQSLRSLWQHL